MSNFNKRPLELLMDGLEISVVKKSQIPGDLRYDAQYFKKRYLSEENALSAHDLRPIGAFAFVTDGPHGYHEVDDVSQIAMLTAKCASDWFSTRKDADTIAKWVDDANRRSSLKENDVILSTRGTVGNCALVVAESLPANIDQDVARIAIDPSSEFDPAFVVTYLNSTFGQDHIARHASGMVQQGLSLAKVREIPIPLLSRVLQKAVSDVVSKALELRRDANRMQAEADDTLLEALNLTARSNLEPSSYEASSTVVSASNRLDAQFFAPRIRRLVGQLSRSGSTIGAVAKLRKEKFVKTIGGRFRYIEIGDIEGYGTTTSTLLDVDDAPSRATWKVYAGDVITSMVRPIRRLSALIIPEQSGFICSSGFIVLEPTTVLPEVLLTFLRLPPICELMDLYASASMYPAISETDILALPFPDFDDQTSEILRAAVVEARDARSRAQALLDRAKRAVEIAIEASETASLQSLHQAE
jgi:hypothetical protein